MDRDLEAEHIRLTHLSTILGNAQLLRRWAMRSTSLTEAEREMVLRQEAAIEQAVRALQYVPEPRASPTDASSSAVSLPGSAALTGPAGSESPG